MKDYNRSVKLICPLCGNDGFCSVGEEVEDLLNAPGTTKVQCADCKAIYTKDEIIEANSLIIENAEEEIVEEVMKDFDKQLKKALGI